MTTGANEPIPDARASTPKETPNATTAGRKGAIARAPARIARRLRSDGRAARAGGGQLREEADRAGPEAESRIVEPLDQRGAIAVDEHLDQRAPHRVRVG